MINVPSFTPLEQADRTKLFDYTVEQTLGDIERIKKLYLSGKPMSEYACMYALNTVKLQEFEYVAQRLVLPNVRDDLVSLPKSETNPNSGRFAFLPVHPDDRTEYVIDGSFASLSEQQETAAKEYFANNATDTTYEQELADNAEFLKENPDQVWPLSLQVGKMSTLMTVNYVKLETFEDEESHPVAVWRGRPIISMHVHPIISSPMLYHSLAHADQVNEKPYTDLTTKGVRRKLQAAQKQNEADAESSELRIGAALKETSPKKLLNLQRIIGGRVQCMPDTNPGRLW